jgi:hypothetical protein
MSFSTARAAAKRDIAVIVRQGTEKRKRWNRFGGSAPGQREAHRADLHQVLAHASLYDADQIRATLVYPRWSPWSGRSLSRTTVSSARYFIDSLPLRDWA